jgi:aminoglycoside 3-N-acetyltransferase
VAEDARKLGVLPGRTLLVHSSLSSLGFVTNGPQTVIEGLGDAVGPRGTLVFPTHSWEAVEAGSRVFDVRHTPSCVGAITEAFRQLDGTARSLHPTHSVAALGPDAAWIVADHDRCSTPCGEASPYDKALLAECQILFLGTGLESNTAYHTIEALAGVSYLLEDEDDEFTLIDAQGAARRARIRRHRARIRRRFAEREGVLVDAQVVRRGSVGPARALLLEGRPFRAFMLAKLVEEPAFLLHAGN